MNTSGKRIADLREHTQKSGSDVLPIVDILTHETKKITVDNLLATTGTPSGSVAGGVGSNWTRISIVAGAEVQPETPYNVTLPQEPTPGSAFVFLNGIYLSEGDDYSLTGGLLTFVLDEVLPGDRIQVRYTY